MMSCFVKTTNIASDKISRQYFKEHFCIVYHKVLIYYYDYYLFQITFILPLSLNPFRVIEVN
jgi:hypothetical protein